jgi:hypothetical protein
MKTIEEVKSRLMASDLVEHPLNRTRPAQDIIDECIAPLVAELAAAREAMDCVAFFRELAQLSEDLVIYYYGDDADDDLPAWNIRCESISDCLLPGKTLLAALRRGRRGE